MSKVLELARICREQHGLITRAQALEVGLSRSSIARRLRSGEWRRVLPRVFASAHVLVSSLQAFKAVELWAGKGAAISHQSALSLWLGTARDGRIDVSTAHRRGSPSATVRARHVRPLPPEHVVEREGVRVTTVERTAVDLAGRLSPEAFAEILDALFEQRLTTPAALLAFVNDRGCRRVPGRFRVRSTLRRRLSGRRVPRTALEMEVIVWRCLRANRFAPALQGEHPSQFRWAFEAERVVIELDDGRELPQVAYDRKQLREAGWSVFPISVGALRDRSERLWILRQLDAELARRADLPPLQPSLLPGVDLGAVAREISQLNDFHQLPPALKAMGSLPAQCMLELEDWEAFSPAAIDELKELADRVNLRSARTG